MQILKRHPIGSTMLLLAGLCTVSAWAEPLPPIHQQGAVRYLSGGIGKDEALAVEAAAPAWSAVLEFVAHDSKTKSDEFLANVSVQVRDAHQHTVLATVSDGPFVLAQLAPGQYQVEATVDGMTVTRSMSVPAQGSHREVLVWRSTRHSA
jgi:hypothetical protein